MGQVSMFLTMLGVFDTLVLWPLMLALYFTGAETFDWDKLPWMYICGSAALGLCEYLCCYGLQYKVASEETQAKRFLCLSQPNV